ncbi:MAG TPA: glycoside hydrolase family 95 protein [Tepidisphaeraceae bacterium]|nr:glycoside hydrolase family 95 protein [Tepidisphaeraceae bacterium]
MKKYLPVLIGVVCFASLAHAQTNRRNRPPAEHRVEKATLNGQADPPTGKWMLWYRQPARRWEEALPVGNGRMGAMVYGGVASEDIQLNEDSLWVGYPHDAVNPAALGALPQVRQLIFENKLTEAGALAGRTMLGVPPRIQSYQPLGDLLLDSPDVTAVDNYRRDLDLETGITTVSYAIAGAHFKREVLASNPDDILAVHLTCDQPGKINVGLALHRDQDAKLVADPSDPDRLILRGRIHLLDPSGKEVGERFECQVLAIPTGGKLTAANNRIEIRGADELTLLIAGATDYRGGDPEQSCRHEIESATKPLDALRQAAVEDHRQLFDRVDLDLGSTTADVAKLPTDQRLSRLKDDVFDPGLAALYFQYGRYLLIGCSRPGTLPANLQGLWNNKMAAAWNSDYHTNINIQMNYWPAEVCNLSECTQPLFDLMDKLTVAGARTAREQYGCGGWVVHHLTDPFFRTEPCDSLTGVWPMGAAWMCQHPYEHYLFTGDKKFLADQGYPLMKGAAEFILDFLVPAPKGTAFPGKLVTAPSFSPENVFRLPDGTESKLTYGATMDLEIIHDLLTNCIEAAKTLGVDEDFQARCQSALDQLAPLQISKRDGRLQEWIEDYQDVDPHHRHSSHLFALYPGRQISPEATPELAEAARKALVSRGDGGTEWSLPWKMCFWARFHDGDHAQQLLQTEMAHHLYPNMFNAYPPFQIDGNLGISSAIPEMLLQSQAPPDKPGDQGPIRLLPALPKSWPTGHVTGLCARGGFVVDISWTDGHLTEAKILSKIGGTLRIQTAESVKITCDGQPLQSAGGLFNSKFEFPTEAGKAYILDRTD